MKINDDSLGKFDSQLDKGIFVGYSTRSKAYKCYNNRLWKIVERIDVKINEALPEKEIEDHEVDTPIEENEEELEKEEKDQEKQHERSQTPSKVKFLQNYHPEE